ncbi:Alpha-1,3-mannosyltransferase CMT1 [Zalerion maritima]|uniref:Alpha-1,3-mannosyltransferase CMT1 n=1 Tax=Zalerion maritima TaxID=339359 RepID=A0AAD5RJC7_9PEZI|nr:Alpha-1,3-mannosyltransferase CMT1 [Zalerion maritima]
MLQLKRRPLGVVLASLFFLAVIVTLLHFDTYPGREFTSDPVKTEPDEVQGKLTIQGKTKKESRRRMGSPHPPPGTRDGGGLRLPTSMNYGANNESRRTTDDANHLGIRPPQSTSSEISRTRAKTPTPAPATVTAATAAVEPTPTGDSRPTSTSSETKPWTSAVQYVQAIMDPASSAIERMACPALDTPRYTYLKPPHAHSNITSQQQYTYLFALDLVTVEPLLPRLLGSVVEVIRFLGVSNCLLSIVEGPNKDHTSEILKALSPTLKSAGIVHEFVSSDVDTSAKVGRDRIQKLAELRNKALEPLTSENSKHKFVRDSTVVFLNDVAICPNDILELVHQKKFLGATMTCAMDWTYSGKDPTFYDVWIARTIEGDSFFDIPPDGSWNDAWNLFWNNGDTKERFHLHKPFQVFSCWNGAVAFSSEAVTGKDAIKFRAHREGECHQGEPQMFCKDLWFHGLGRIAVIPTVNLEYSDHTGTLIKVEKGHTSQWTPYEDQNLNQIEWVRDPPEMVRCMPGDYKKQEWRSWYEGAE